MKVVVLLAVFLSASAARGQETFRLPQNLKGFAVEYLEKMKVSDISRQLTESEKHDLSRLFVKAFVISIRRHGQDYTLRTGTPIYRLLVANFPSVSSREGEGGAIIFLGAITSFFNALPEYRGDVVRVLREDIGRKNCR
jgi:hypothetical protein